MLNISMKLRRFASIRKNPVTDNSSDAHWQRLITIGRFASHATILVVLIAALVLAQNYSAQVLGSGTAQSQRPDQTLVQSPRLVTYASISHAERINADGDLLIRQFVATTPSESLESRHEVISYTVQAGDTTEAIATKFSLQPSSLIWSNRTLEDAPDRLSIGQNILIPPTDGLLYEVQANDTLSNIADVFRAKLEDIVKTPANRLNNGSNLIPGMQLFVPKGVKQITYNAIQSTGAQSSSTAYSRRAARPLAVAPANPTNTGGAFMWPTPGTITQGFFWGHGGLDIANAMGMPVMASESGIVRYAGWDDTGYGWLVEIDHGNGFATLYAHLSEYPVEVGQSVVRGQLIGLMGSSGRSTGPHTHFEIRYNGVPQNPLFYLP